MTGKLMKKRLWIFFLLLLVFSCKKKEIGPQSVDNADQETKTGNSSSGNTPESKVFIINEGNFNFGNASLSAYHPNTGKNESHLFQNTNGYVLGDVAQSMTIHNGMGYLVVNNSQKIEVIDPEDHTSQHTITGFNSPRYLLPVSINKAYVSDLYANEIYVVDLLDHTIVNTISVSGWTEKMAVVNEEVYVCGTERDKIYVINSNSDQLVDSIAVGTEPNSLVMDAGSDLWVLCGGGVNEDYPSLHQIDINTRTVKKSFAFPSKNQSPGNLQINKERTKLYFLNNGLYEMPVSAASLPVTPLIPEGSSLFYGLGIDPFTQDFYISDAIDYVQKGRVYRFNREGHPLDTISAGIIPSAFSFYQ